MSASAAEPWDRVDPALFERLAERYGTPYFLYDATAVRQRIARVRAAFGGVFKVYYAVKTNPNLALLRALRDAADGLDISSGGELAQARTAGYDAGVISFAGPAKTTAELAAALDAGIGSISVESRRELDEIIRLAGTRDRRANIVLRVNPIKPIKEFGMKMGGRPVQFGIDEEEIGAIAATVRDNGNALAFKGLHLYVGTQCFDPAGIIAHVRNCLALAERFEAETGLACSTVNFGGGFGISPSEAGKELNVEAVGQGVRDEIAAFRARSRGERTLIFELGRYLATEAGLYVTRVIDRKLSRGRTYCVADGGLHHHLAAAGVFGVGLRSNFILRNLTHPDAEAETCDIAGPLCNPTDLLGVNTTLASPSMGDLIGVTRSGGYSLTASPILFLGRPSPAEIVLVDGEPVLGRKPHTIEDFN